LGYSVEEIESMKTVLGDYTLGDLFEMPETTIKKYEELTSLLSTISSEGTMSANTLQNIIDKYPSLMSGADGSFSMSNVKDNILGMFGVGESAGNGEGLTAIYSKQFYEQLKGNEAIYDAFLTQLESKGFSTESIARLRQFSTFTDEALEALVFEDYRDPNSGEYASNQD
jgi:hypothetical protein